MKFSCLQENLNKGLQIVSKAVPVKGSLPILSNVLIASEDNRLKLAATNLETAITTYVNASIEEEGAVTVPAKVIKDFVSNLSPSTINGHLDGEVLVLKSDKTKSKLNGTAAKDYPALPVISEKAKVINLDPKEFSYAVSLVAFASSQDEARPLFTGIYLNYTNGVLTITSTDGFRLSEKTMVLKGDSADFTAIIPAKTLFEVSKIFASSEEPIKMQMSENENLALFSSGDTTVATRIIDGQYPDYKRIIPTETAIKAEFGAEEFFEAVRLTSVFVKEGNNNTIKLRLDPEGLIKISSISSEAGAHESEFSADVEGQMLELAFNTKYLLDFLNNVKGQKIILQANTNSTACIFKAGDIADFLHVIMPIQL